MLTTWINVCLLCMHWLSGNEGRTYLDGCCAGLWASSVNRNGGRQPASNAIGGEGDARAERPWADRPRAPDLSTVIEPRDRG